MEISQDVDHKPIIFIRFNPDEYYIGETKIQSCFGYDKLGICRLKPKYINEWSERLSVLKQQIEYWTNPLNKTKPLKLYNYILTGLKFQIILLNKNHILRKNLLLLTNNYYSKILELL
jgi:hypothetical protein